MRYLWWLQALLLFIVIPLVLHRVAPGSLASLPGMLAVIMSPFIMFAVAILILIGLIRAVLPYSPVEADTRPFGS